MTLVDCPKCDGNGSYYFAGGNLDCSWCRGTGKMEDKDAQDYTDNRNKAYNNASDLIHNTDGFIDGSDVPTSGIYENHPTEDEMDALDPYRSYRKSPDKPQKTWDYRETDESKASLKAMKDLGAGDFAGDIPDDMDLDEWLGESKANEFNYNVLIKGKPSKEKLRDEFAPYVNIEDDGENTRVIFDGLVDGGKQELESLGYDVIGESKASEVISEDEKDEIFQYLFDLQESGVTNMFGSGAYVERVFPHLDKSEVGDVITEWMSNWDSIAKRMGIESRASEGYITFDKNGVTVERHDEEWEAEVQADSIGGYVQKEETSGGDLGGIIYDARESKASEDFVTYDIDGNVITRKEEPDGTFEDMMARSDDPEKTLNAWNNIVRILEEEEEQKKSTESNEEDDYEYGFIPKVSGFGEDKDKNLPIKDHTHNFTSGYQHSNGIDYTWQCIDPECGATKNQDLYMESKASESFDMHSDAGHGWLEVPKSLLKELGIGKDISMMSYQKGNSVFIEEDGDLSTFKRAYEEKYGSLSINELPQTDDESPIRDYYPYGGESKASEYSIKEEFDLQDQDGKYEMLSKADLSVTDATKYSTYSHSELPEEVKDSLKGDEGSFGESWSRKSSIDKIEALERLGIKQGDAIQLSGLEFEDYAEDLQGALKGEEWTDEDARTQMKDQVDYLNNSQVKDFDDVKTMGYDWQEGEEVENPNSEFQQYYPDYNNIGESQTNRTKYECEYCDHGFKSNEALMVHHNDKHAIAPESLDGYDYAEKPYWLKLQERTIIHKNFDPIWGSPIDEDGNVHDRANDDDLHEYGNPESSEGDTLKCSHCGQIFNPDNEQVLYSHLAGHGITESKASETISDYEREQRRLNYEEELTEEEKSTQASYFNKLHNDSLDRKNKQFMEDEQVFGEPEEMYGTLGMESKASELTDIEKRKKRLAMQGDGSGMDGNSYGMDEPYRDLDEESLANEAGLEDHSCPECGFITSDNSDYVDHLNAHEE